MAECTKFLRIQSPWHFFYSYIEDSIKEGSRVNYEPLEVTKMLLASNIPA